MASLTRWKCVPAPTPTTPTASLRARLRLPSPLRTASRSSTRPAPTSRSTAAEDASAPRRTGERRPILTLMRSRLRRSRALRGHRYDDGAARFVDRRRARFWRRGLPAWYTVRRCTRPTKERINRRNRRAREECVRCAWLGNSEGTCRFLTCEVLDVRVAKFGVGGGYGCAGSGVCNRRGGARES